MSTIALAPRADSQRTWEERQAQPLWNALIVSGHVENRKTLLRILDGLPINTFVASTVEQAREVLPKRAWEVIFCEESLPDGSYRTLLESAGTRGGKARFVVTLCDGDWDEYLEAMRLGATEVLKYPLQSIDVELALIRAARIKEKETL